MDFKKFNNTLNKIDWYVYALCEIKDGKHIPFYIGKGKGVRCLQHLEEDIDSIKAKRIQELQKKNIFAIDILRHKIEDDKTAKLIEATCIDVMGIDVLTNKVRGYGVDMGRMSIEEIDNLVSGEIIKIEKEHRGLAFLLNDTYKSGMPDLNLFECTRGIWVNPPKDDTSIKYAYATYSGVVKEVYEIDHWVKAGTQQYFTRDLSTKDLEKRWEFVGKIASKDIREKYKGKVIDKDRSYGSPFVKVGF
jgi:uncharacterized protein